MFGFADKRTRRSEAVERRIHDRSTLSFRPSLETLESRVVPSYVMQRIALPPGTTFIGAVHLNDHGDVAGYAFNDRPGSKNDQYFAFSWSFATKQSTAIPLPVAGARIQGPNVIGFNNHGVICVKIFSDGREQSYVLHPDRAAQSLGTLPGVSVAAMDINDAGAVVGNLYGNGHHNRGFVVTPLDADGNGQADTWYRDSNGDGANDLMTVLEPPLPGPPDVTARSINAAGQVAGHAEDFVDGVSHAVIWDKVAGGYVARDLGRFTDATGVERDCLLSRINAAGQATGILRGPSGNDRGLYWNGTSLIDIGTLGGSSSGVSGINDGGQVAGNSSTSSGNDHGFIWSSSTPIQDLGTLAGLTTSVTAINNLGQVVGSSNLRDPATRGLGRGSGLSHGFVWDQFNGMRDLNSITNRGQFEIYSANDINALGHILAHGVGPLHADVLLVPTGSPLVSASASRKPTAETLSISQAKPLLTEAISRWKAAGAATSLLHGIDVRIADLGGTMLGLASGHTIWLDDNAAGWGWFVDPTPGDDREFRTPGDQGEQGRMDLLSVLAHELGHLLGLDHDDHEEGVMGETLTPGTRRTPTSHNVKQAAAMDVSWPVPSSEPPVKSNWLARHWHGRRR